LVVEVGTASREHVVALVPRTRGIGDEQARPVEAAGEDDDAVAPGELVLGRGGRPSGASASERASSVSAKT
jgi:hypothetical protein